MSLYFCCKKHVRMLKKHVCNLDTYHQFKDGPSDHLVKLNRMMNLIYLNSLTRVVNLKCLAPIRAYKLILINDFS